MSTIEILLTSAKFACAAKSGFHHISTIEMYVMFIFKTPWNCQCASASNSTQGKTRVNGAIGGLLIGGGSHPVSIEAT
jgi:hypothetical protein